MSVRIWTVLPKTFETNGLDVIEKALEENPDAEHVIIARINRKRFTGDDDTHETTQVARLVHVEVMTDEQAREHALKLLLRAHKDRTGQDQLPYPDGDAE